MTNWPEYDARLVRQGDLTVWLTEEAVATSHTSGSSKRGGQPIYSDLAIETGLAEAYVIIPPRATAVPTEAAASQRDWHIKVIEEHGLRRWQRRTGYGRRSLVETTMFRYKPLSAEASTLGLCPTSRPRRGLAARFSTG